MTDDDQTTPLGLSLREALGDTAELPESYVPVEPPEGPEPPPAAVARYLMAKEIQAGVIAVHRHWIELLLPGTAAIGGLLAAIIVNAYLYEAGTATLGAVRALWIAWILALGWAAWRYVSWRCWWFVITGGRLLTIAGVLGKKVTPLPLKRIRDLELTRSGLGQLLGYGDIECESIATDHALHTITRLPFDVELWTKIWEMLLPRTAQGVRFEGMADDAW